MKRVKRIAANTRHGTVEITIRVNTNGALTQGALTNSEVDRAVTFFADAAMRAIADAHFLSVPLSKIVVR